LSFGNLTWSHPAVGIFIKASYSVEKVTLPIDKIVASLVREKFKFEETRTK